MGKKTSSFQKASSSSWGNTNSTCIEKKGRCITHTVREEALLRLFRGIFFRGEGLTLLSVRGRAGGPTRMNSHIYYGYNHTGEGGEGGFVHRSGAI